MSKLNYCKVSFKFVKQISSERTTSIQRLIYRNIRIDNISGITLYVTTLCTNKKKTLVK